MELDFFFSEPGLFIWAFSDDSVIINEGDRFARYPKVALCIGGEVDTDAEFRDLPAGHRELLSWYYGDTQTAEAIWEGTFE